MKRLNFIVLLLFIACNNLPIGEQEFDLRGDFRAQYTELDFYNSLSFYNRFAKLGSSSNLVIGKNNDYESRILLEFDFPDTTYQGLDEIKLILKVNSDFENDTIAYSLHLLTSDFEENHTGWLLKKETTYWDDPGADYETDSIRYGIISGDSLTIRFNYIELARIQDADGMILIPRGTGFTYFYSREGFSSPEFLLVKNDGTTTIPLKSDCHIVVGPQHLYIENWLGTGYPYRNYVKFLFDTLLVNKKAVYAELVFRIDQIWTRRDSIEIGIRELKEPIDDYDTEVGPLTGLKRYSAADTIIRIDVVRYIQNIIEHPDSNFGFFIIMSPENYDIANMKLVDHSYHLNVGYISPPQER